MVRYAVLGTGSCGNAYAFFDGTDTILIDCGYSFKELNRRLEIAQIPIDTVRALFLTHLHPDHSCGAGVFARKTGLPVIMSRKANQTETTVCAKLNIPMTSLVTVEPGEVQSYGPFSLHGFYTTHDSSGSMGWKVKVADSHFMILTDTGVFDQAMVDLATGCDVLFLEANYDVRMLEEGPYPYHLKKRIAGDWGHLSNDQSFEFLERCDVIHKYCGKEHIIDVKQSSRIADIKKKRVYFIHLSDCNNEPSLVARQADGYVWDGEYVVCERGQGYLGEL